MVKVVHIITDLSVGGAQNMLYKLLASMDRQEFISEVVSLKEIGPIGERIQALGIPVKQLCMRSGVPSPRSILRLADILRHSRPDVIQTWMYHADLLGGLAASIAGKIPIAWNVRHSRLDPEIDKKTTILIGRVCAKLSHRMPARIISCSEAGRQVHISLGYAANKIQVIPNGFDLGAYQPSPTARQSVREELNIPEQALIIGHVGRYHPMKDHHGFVQAAKALHTRYPEVHFVLCGDEVTWNNPELEGWIEEAKLRPVFRLLGRRSDLPRLNAAFDIASLASRYGEGFPNVVGEAMACGIPCVVTDVGDAGYIVGDAGITLPPRDPDALAAAWIKVLEMGTQGRQALGEKARQRVQQMFDINVIVCRYEQLYRELSHAV